TVNFSLDGDPKSSYPKIVLTKKPFGIITTIAYFGDTSKDIANYIAKSGAVLLLSARFAVWLKFLLWLTLVIVIIEIISWKTELHPIDIIPGGLAWLISILQKNEKTKVKVKVVINDSEKRLAGAKVYVVDGVKFKLLASGITNSDGDINFNITDGTNFEIIAAKRGYETARIVGFDRESLEAGEITITVKRLINKKGMTIQEWSCFGSETGRFLFGFCLVILAAGEWMLLIIRNINGNIFDFLTAIISLTAWIWYRYNVSRKNEKD
ncbi:MAG TPA: hypothetical protein VF828_02315, partial [Patescibacteria group bacterium]